MQNMYATQFSVYYDSMCAYIIHTQPDSFKNSLCLASLEERGVLNLSIHCQKRILYVYVKIVILPGIQGRH